MSKAKKVVITILLITSSCLSWSMVFDNRFFPLIQKPFISVAGRPSHLGAYPFITTASKAINAIEQDIGIPELYGKFDLGQLSTAFTIAGLPNPLPSGLRLLSIPYDTQGVIQSQGIEFAYYQSIRDIIGFGFNWLLMRSNSRQDFFVTKGIPGVENETLDDYRRAMFQEVGLCIANATQAGMGDLDLYIRGGYFWEYMLKFKRIDAGARFGALVPAGVTRKLDAPASVPFGGNGFWGLYGALDAEFELREDLKVGFYLRLSKRFAKVRCERLPVTEDPKNPTSCPGEPYIFGVITGNVKITPGYNFAFLPYAQLENLRAGLGVRVAYTVTKHWRDCWEDARCDKTIPITLGQVMQLSEWKSDYVSLTVFYDFGKVKVTRSLEPILIFTWDIPSLFFASERSAITNKISLGLECNF